MTTPDLHAAPKNAAAAAWAPPGGAANAHATTVQASNEWWRKLDQRIYQCITLWIEQWWEPQKRVLIDAVGQVFSEHRASVRETITNLKERVIRLETTSNFEERFTRLAHEVKHGTEIPQSELLARIEGLQRQLDELKKVAAQPGPQGPPGKDGKLPIVKVFQKDTVYYTGDVVICDGSTYQALRDTGQNVNHADWICLARAGRDGLTPTIRGTYDAYGKYKKLDIVACDGASFVAKRDNPGLCPGDSWQLLSRQGKQGRRGEGITGPRGEKGDKGECGEPGATVVSWQVDRERYRISPLMSDGKVGPMMELRGLFEQFLNETGG